jgi:hypothetical protein
MSNWVKAPPRPPQSEDAEVAMDDPIVELPEEDPPEQPQAQTPHRPQTPLGEIEQLEADCKAATERILKLEGQASSAMKQFNEANEALPKARAERDEILASLREVKPYKPPPLPSLPSREEYIAMARALRPDWDDRRNIELAERFHAACSDGLTLQSERYYLQPPPKMTGTDVKDVSNSHYEIKMPRERKSYG